MRVFLKVKIKSLAEEAKIIRHQERQFPREGYGIRWQLKTHRKHEVRPEARDALLAYAFLRGRAYAQVEQKCHEPPRWANVERMVVKYGNFDKSNPLPKNAIRDWAGGIASTADVPAMRSSVETVCEIGVPPAPKTGIFEKARKLVGV